MRDSGPSIRLTACLVASLLLHAGVLWPAMARVVASPSPAADLPEPPPTVPPPPPVDLGVERSEAATTTWVGFEEYREHLARLAEIEQAAFTTATGGGAAPELIAAGEAGGPDAGAVGEAATTPEAASVEPVDAEPEDAEPVDAASEPEDAAPEPVDAAPEPGEPTVIAAAAESAPRPIIDRPVAGPAGRERPSLAEAAAESVAENAEDAEDVEATEAAEARTGGELEQVLGRVREVLATLATRAAAAGGAGGRDSRSTPPATETAEVSSPPGDAPAREGVVADRQSPATSRIDVPRDRLRPDRPIAREGLEVRPREPEFWTIERLTAVPRNPVVLIRFGRDGVPTEARLVEATGDARFDQAILASLYRWRAAGPKLADLASDGTLDLEFRIVILGQ